MGTILIEGIKLYAYHGCLDEEAKIGGSYVVDVTIETDFAEAAKTDQLSETIDYVDVYDIVKKQMAVRSKLIEHVGQRILDEMALRFKTMGYAEVKVTKISPPMNGNVQQVSVVLIYGSRPTR